MRKTKPQLWRDSGVSTTMGSVSSDRNSPKWDQQRGPQVVAMPPPHEGVRRALLGSFGMVPAMPEEFTRLLAKLR
jgi:hypothetical protein